MIWRHLCLARAIAASGVLSFLALGPVAARAGEPGEPLPADDTAVETVRVLDAEKAGTLAVEVRGAGQDGVRVQLKNQTGRRLRVVLPPGLVAASSLAQPGGGPGGGGGGGLQNMGLGAVGNQAGGFGQFAANRGGTGFRSVPATGDSAANGAVVVPVGQAIDLPIPAVCLNFGAPSPTAKHRLRLIDVDDYSTDVRVRKALRALGTLGTSQGTAQAAMWRICNGVSYEEMLARGGKGINPHEVALAARFVRAVEADADLPRFDAARVFVTITGEPSAAKDVARLAKEIEGMRILGLPVAVAAKGEVPQGPAPIVHLGIALNAGDSRETKGKVVVQVGEGLESLDWTAIGQARFDELSMIEALDAASLSRAVDHAVAATFVTARVARRSPNGTTLEIKNRLPFTLANVTLKAGSSLNAPLVDVAGMGVGPGRNGQATIAAANGTVERVELNGL